MDIRSSITGMISYNDQERVLRVNDVPYQTILIEDKLESIVKATTEALVAFVKGNAIALDFSLLRPRGTKTSSTGISTGAASFAKTFADMLKAVSYENSSTRIKPIVLLSWEHADYPEYEEMNLDTVIQISRTNDWDATKFVVAKPKPIPKPVVVALPEKEIPFWKLSLEERSEIRKDRHRRSTPKAT